MSSATTFDAAVKCYLAGQMAQAESLCQQVLAAEPQNFHVWNLLGVVLFFLGRKELAVQHLEEAVRLKPDFADAYNNLGNVLKDLGRLDEAIGMYERCLHWVPDQTDALDNLGKVLRENKKSAAAVGVLRRLLRLRPESADAHYRLGLALKDLGEHAAAVDSLRQALRIQPNHTDALNHLGIALLALNRPAEAAAAFEQVVKLSPNFSPGYCNLGSAVWELKRLDEAIAYSKKALELDPKNGQALNNLGGLHIELGSNAEAVAVLRSLLEIDPKHETGRRNLAAALLSLGFIDEAITELDRTLIAEPQSAEGHKNRAIAYLTAGDYRRGWEEYEWRWGTKEFTARNYAQPAWRGESLTGKTILVYAEQGLGDSLHFVRYLPVVRQRGAKVVFECKPPMRRFLEGLNGIDALIPAGESLPPFDVHAALMSLPHWLDLPHPQDSPPPPYLFADPQFIEHWRAELGSLPGFKVGINWQGRPTHKRDRFRSIPLSQFLPLAEIPGIQLISLQKGFGSEQLRESAAVEKVLELDSRLDETAGAFMDTAAVLHSLDLVITSDTSLAHLAGAMNRPVWVALCAMPDWRWLLAGERTPWYPSMRLFRQRTLGNWNDVFGQMEAELRALAKSP